MANYKWLRDQFAGFVCEMPDNVTLIVSPCRTVSRRLKLAAVRGTKWRAQCSVWEQSTRTMSRFGRDAWREECVDSKAAKSLAQEIYEQALVHGTPAS